ncbi:MAG TPA: sensor histidine kinase, partial [Vicinamibacterales bacterium]
ANAPTYCWVDSGMGLGIVGGSLRSQTAQAEAVGALAVRVLRGEQADTIPLSSTNLNVNQVDWRELRRWRISEARVPAGTQVRFREPSLWDQYRHYIVGGVAILLGQAVLIGALLLQRSRRHQAEERVVAGQTKLRASYAQIRDLGGRLLNSQEAERSRIARELHDDISQQVALLEIDLELLGRSLHGDAGTLADGALGRVQGLARSVHDLSHRLHPAKLRLLGLVPALSHLQHELSRPGFDIRFTHEDVPSTLPPDLTLSLFRVAQEALQNAVKYSQAHEVSAHLKGRPESLELTIVDDGVGFDVPSLWGTGLGLVSMGERLEPFGGSLDIQSSPGAGTRLHVTVPLRSAESKEAVAV